MPAWHHPRKNQDSRQHNEFQCKIDSEDLPHCSKFLSLGLYLLRLKSIIKGHALSKLPDQKISKVLSDIFPAAVARENTQHQECHRDASRLNYIKLIFLCFFDPSSNHIFFVFFFHFLALK